MSEQITMDRADELLREGFLQLKKREGRARPRDLFDAVASSLQLTDYERQTTKSGTTRWETVLRWYSVDCVKAGYLKK